MHAQGVHLGHGIGHGSGGHHLHPGAHQRFVEGGVEFRHFGDGREQGFFLAAFGVESQDVLHGAVLVVHRVFTGLQLFPPLCLHAGLGFEFHLVQAGWQALDHVQRGDQLIMLLAGNVATHKNSQMPHALVQHVNDGAPSGGNGALVAPGVDDPVQRLWHRCDVVPV